MSAAVDAPVRRSGRRLPSLFLLVGLLLAVSTVAGYTWELADELADLISDLTVDSPDRSIRLGHAGLIAAALGWAAFARTPARAAIRAPSALVGVPVVVGALIAAGLLLGRVVATQASRADEFKPVNEFSVEPSFAVDPASVTLVLSALFVLAFLAPLAQVSAARGTPLRPVPVAVLLAPVLLDGVVSLVSGAEIAPLLSVLSALWLVWALRRASAAAAARTMPPDRSPAGP